MLRGPQTPGELKQRTERMHAFADLGGVHETLERLISRGLIAVLERRPGQKEERFMQLLGGDAEAPVDAGRVTTSAPSGTPPYSSGSPGPQPVNGPSPTSLAHPAAGALAELQERVARLEREVAQLRAASGGQSQGGQPRQERSAGITEEGEEQERATGETLEWM
jgi:uncharacterized protein YceH (UPF0502 family)